MAVIYLRQSKRHNELCRKEIILTFRQGSTIYQRCGTEIFILDKPMYWDGNNMVLRGRMMTDELRYHREQKLRLEQMCAAVNTAWEHTDRKQINPTWLKDVIERFNHPEKYVTLEEGVVKSNVTAVFAEYMEKHKVSLNREKHMWSLWRVFRRYELWCGITFEFETFSHEDLEGFRNFLTTENESLGNQRTTELIILRFTKQNYDERYRK